MAKQKNLEKVFEIKKVIAGLFCEKGYQGTSMREIGRALGMNQSSLYHYFKSKEEILFDLMNDAMDDALKSLTETCASDLSPEEKLSEVLVFYARYYAGEQESLALLVNEMALLSDRHHRILLKKQRLYVELIKSILLELTKSGKMKGIDPAIATFAFFGMVHYTIKWYHKGGTVGPEALANLFVEIFTRGILKSS
ncbi:MAG: TetR/AcrR family transcriptional regulator [Desulfatiglandales bacterium]